MGRGGGREGLGLNCTGLRITISSSETPLDCDLVRECVVCRERAFLRYEKTICDYSMLWIYQKHCRECTSGFGPIQ